MFHRGAFLAFLHGGRADDIYREKGYLSAESIQILLRLCERAQEFSAADALGGLEILETCVECDGGLRVSWQVE